VAKSNYAAWQINAHHFSDDWDDLTKLKFFARYAVLAPSGHNTQPWRFSADDSKLVLEVERSRHLPYSGVQANEPYVSLGSCLGTLELAAHGFGYQLVIHYDLADDRVATVALGSKTAADPSLLDAIVQRVSNRNFYDETPLPESLLKTIAATESPQVSTLILNDRKDLEYVAKLTTEATLATFADQAFRNELSKWVRNNITRQPDGMPGFVQGIPTPVSLFARHVIKRLDVSKDQAKKDSGRVLHSSSLAVITIHDTDRAALLDGGRAYARICILAQQQGVASTGVGAAIIDPGTTQTMTAKYQLPGKPIAIIRLGRTTKRARHTPRHSLSSLLH
jgi:hypothetical protein